MSASHHTAQRKSRALTLPRLAVVAASVALGAAACSSAGAHTTALPSSTKTTSTHTNTSTHATTAATVLPNSSLSGPGAFLGPVRQIPVNGIKIGYRQFGAGPDLIMVMGDTGTMSDWTVGLLNRLSQHYHITIFDNRGVGYTTDDTAVPDSIPLMADDTVDLIKTLGLQHPTLLGWSMGGEIGLTIAALHPGALSALVTSGSDLGGSQAINATAAVSKELNSPDTTPRQMLGLLFPASAETAAMAYVGQLELVPEEKTSSQTLARQYQAEQAYEGFEQTWDELPSSNIPMLITNGTLDAVNPAGNAAIVAERAKHAKQVLFPGAGHAMLIQDADKFVTLVTQFTKTTVPSA